MEAGSKTQSAPVSAPAPANDPGEKAAAANAAGLPETTDEARAYLVKWHREAFTTAPFFNSYIENTLAGDFAYHLARWLAKRAPAVGAGDLSVPAGHLLVGPGFIKAGGESFDGFSNKAVSAAQRLGSILDADNRAAAKGAAGQEGAA